MQLFPVDRIYDFMKYRWLMIGFSSLCVLASIVLLFVPGPKLGTDFAGGTEIEVAFRQSVSATDIQDAVENKGFSRPDVIQVEDKNNPYRYLVRVQEISTIDESVQREVERRLCLTEHKVEDCQHPSSEVKFSPGGEKITIRFEGPPDLDWVREQVAAVSGIELRAGQNNPFIQNARDHRVEVSLKSQGDQLMDALRAGLPEGATPDEALRTEWIGPKAGAQLRDAAVKSIVFALIFIMAYVAFRFDARFAPGGAVALAHDAIVTVGILILLGREINLTTVAAILTIVGYSINDTVVIYDRVRENIGRARGASFSHLINISISETLGRTIITSFSTILVMVCFFIWGTGSLKDFALTLVIGMVLGVYSTVYIALPVSEFLDRKVFSRGAKRASPVAPVSSGS